MLREIDPTLIWLAPTTAHISIKNWCKAQSPDWAYLMYESPGVLLRDGRREDFEDLAEVEAVLRVEGAGEPHDDYKLQRVGSADWRTI